ncbi:alpha-galactosidase C precursor [Aspergillus terreus NIH2624]|uniref:Probable alpha-galactosidase C n=1 Tax=Aspergillus terreus (strain NIH 2624 / FGSC A1156) TaxID=341663 RepID=AGALC_ASPTN|nr:alpha-galactosidase C precursor [Aspergillus terreus NIH2624]Q0CVH2.1 RecName: Full=Probable alpha-galactosidase C; AltName: Full=Melibiase C; Flags: Precursor [Aspergillus terreus NIH2624]EAU37274.1 alpha-galactosidase C precursor [Aspergillus terreus NIH2624]
MVAFMNSATFVAGLFTLWSRPIWATPASNTNAVVVNGTAFTLNGDHVSYRFHVDDATGDLFSDHFGPRVSGNFPTEIVSQVNGWVNTIGRVRREFPDQGRGDFRIPAIRIRQTAGYTVSELLYRSHTVIPGKPALPGLPATFGSEEDVTTLVVHLYDEISEVAADLSYSIFPKYDAVVRSVNVTNQGAGNITIETLASLSVDFPYEDLDMVYLRGDWAREAHSERRKVEYGTQGFDSSAGYSSHLHNPFLAIMNPATTESQGETWGFSLVYSGSFAVNVERGSQGFTRALLGLNPGQLSWVLRPGESLVSPECVAVYSADGIGGMSRLLHRLYRNHLIKSKFAVSDRPVLLNSWEGLGFNYNETTVYQLATEAAELGVKLFVLDDGWFGDKYPRTADNAGLGDWVPNPDRFPHGLPHEVDRITALHPGNDTSTNLRFGLWFEPEMVNPNSSLYHQHPDWALHAGSYPRTLTRNQLVLNMALPEVQDYVIKSVSDILDSADISYVKWDNNRGIHETPSPSTDHQYMLGMYRVFDNLTTKYPNVLWEGCASGGGRFDPGVLQYFPQIWTSDDTDALERITIQMGTSLAYPPSAMGAHLSAVPNQQTGRTLPITFRAHVAMMGGSFGLELNPAHMPDDERDAVPGLIALAERVNPIVLTGDMYRLSPHDSQWPAVLFISPDGEQAVLFYFQTSPRVDNSIPRVKMQGLDPQAVYSVDGDAEYSGATLMNVGLQFPFDSDVGSKVVFFQRL